MDLGENLFGLCLSYLDIIDYNWLLNLPTPDTAKKLCSRWKKEHRYEKRVTVSEILHLFNGRIYHSETKEMKRWYSSSGLYHRVGYPAIINLEGAEEWWVDGKRHREDGPAIIDLENTQEWYINGKRHRIDGPALIEPGRLNQWWFNNQLHREDGPAVDGPFGVQEWWLNGIKQ